MQSSSGRGARRRVMFMYSGQGAQYYQMGRELHEREPVFREVLDRAERLVAEVSGRSLTAEIYGRPIGESAELHALAVTHPALVAISHGAAKVLAHRGVFPDAVLGYSLGEIGAAIESSVMSFEAGLSLVVAQAEETERSTEPARMVAILDSPTRLFQWPDVFAGCHLAAANHAQHFVVALPEARSGALLERLSALGIQHVVLPVRRGFHSPLVDGLRALSSHPAAQIAYRAPRLPFYSCQLAAPLEEFHALHLWRVVREPVLFEDTIRRAAREGDWTFVDVGPAGTLAGFVRRILGPDAPVFAAMSQFGDNLRSIDRIVEALK